MSLFLRGGKGVKTDFMIHVFLAHVHSLVKYISQSYNDYKSRLL